MPLTEKSHAGTSFKRKITRICARREVAIAHHGYSVEVDRRALKQIGQAAINEMLTAVVAEAVRRLAVEITNPRWAEVGLR